VVINDIEFYLFIMEKDKIINIIGKKIREIRKIKGFSQEEFAYIADLERAFYGKLESKGKNLTLINLLKVAVALDVEVGEIFPPISEIKQFIKKDL